ncbi:YczE/YyaS/YitT family protein [Clostridium sp.]|uniref:YczE/YyaS/YitT family protein n=1 Tax=Clostridium sp. TaxID=1506 RepID=UPI003F3FF635
MKKYNKYFIFLIGIFIFTFGVALISKSNLGTGSWDAISFGLSNMALLTTGTWMAICSGVALVLAGIIKKKFPNILCFLTSVLVGTGVDFWVKVINGVEVNNIALRYLTFFLGIIVLSFGIGIYLLPSLPPNPIDYLMVTIKEKLSLKVMYAKLLVDGCCIFIALIFKGPIGIGTILATLLVGPLVNKFQDLLQGLYNKLISEKIDGNEEIVEVFSEGMTVENNNCELK